MASSQLNAQMQHLDYLYQTQVKAPASEPHTSPRSRSRGSAGYIHGIQGRAGLVGGDKDR